MIAFWNSTRFSFARRAGIAMILLACFFTGAPVKAEILVATAGPMSGARSWAGEQLRRGAEQAVADINASGGLLGQTLRLIVADDANNAEQARAVAQKLVNDDVSLVVGHRVSDASIAAAPIYADAGVIQISPSSTNPEYTDAGFATAFRVCGRDDVQSVVAASYLTKEWADKNIGIIYDTTSYGRELARRTAERLHEQNVIEKLFVEYSNSERDFSTLVYKLKAAAIHVLYVGGYSQEIGLLARELKDQNMDIQIVAGDALQISDFWEIAGNAGQGARFTFGLDPRELTQAKDLVETFRTAGFEPEGYTLHTYAAISLWAQAVANSGQLDAKVVAKTMKQKRFDTVIGEVAFDEKGDLREHQFVWYEWRDGVYRMLTSVAE